MVNPINYRPEKQNYTLFLIKQKVVLMKIKFISALLLCYLGCQAQDTPENVLCSPYIESEVQAGAGNTYITKHPVIINGVKFNAVLMNQQLLFKINFVNSRANNCIEQGASYKFTFADSTVLEIPTEANANCKGNAYFYLSKQTAKATFLQKLATVQLKDVEIPLKGKNHKTYFPEQQSLFFMNTITCLSDKM